MVVVEKLAKVSISPILKQSLNNLRKNSVNNKENLPNSAKPIDLGFLLF